ncbi:MAG TPA: hypothetical protein VLE93_00245 [Candidatus Saccharimonadales bacterium]|nr:hypothetical protein [Candidatus Saccharimonadales bacterium]
MKIKDLIVSLAVIVFLALPMAARADLGALKDNPLLNGSSGTSSNSSTKAPAAPATTNSTSTTPAGTAATCDGKFNPAEVFKADGLLPPFLRSADAAQNADFSCLGAGISFYTSFLALIVSVVAFFYLLYGAFIYITAFGDDSKATQAKKVITQAIIGLVLAALAYTIISIVNTILQGGASLPN